MARQRKRNKVFNIFKDKFKITFYHKPSMLEDDVYHIILLDDLVRLKIKIIFNVLVIDDVTPVTTTYIPNTYNTIIETLIHQQEFTVLLAITGNITVIESACIKVEAPIIEDPRFTCLPSKLYDELKEYYRDDKTKYGFYLLSVNEQSQTQQVVNKTQQESTNPGSIPIIEQIETKLKSAFSKFESFFFEEDNWAKGKQCNFNGIQFQMFFNIESNEIDLKNFYLNDMESYMDLIKLCEVFEIFEEVTTILREVDDPLLNNICEAKGYQNIENNLAAQVVPVNRKYLQVTYGSYKIQKKIL